MMKCEQCGGEMVLSSLYALERPGTEGRSVVVNLSCECGRTTNQVLLVNTNDKTDEELVALAMDTPGSKAV